MKYSERRQDLIEHLGLDEELGDLALDQCDRCDEPAKEPKDIHDEIWCGECVESGLNNDMLVECDECGKIVKEEYVNQIQERDTGYYDTRCEDCRPSEPPSEW